MAATSTRSRRETAASPPPTKARGGGGLFALVIFGLLFVGGGIFALYYFLGSSPKTDNEMLAYLPADSNLVIGIDVEEALKSPKAKTMCLKFIGEQGFVALLTQIGLSENDIARISIGAKDWSAINHILQPATMGTPATPNPDSGQVTFVIRMKSAVDKARLMQAGNAREERKGGKPYFVLPGAGYRLYFYFPTDTLIVATANEKLLEKILAADPAKPAISEEMLELVKQAGRGSMWFAMQRRALQETTYSGIKENSVCPFLTNEVAEALKGMKSISGWFRFDGDRADFTLSLACADAGAAGRAADKVQAVLDDHRRNVADMEARIKAYKKTSKGLEVAQTAWEASSDILRTGIVAQNGNVVELSAEIQTEGVEALFVTIAQGPRVISQKLPGDPIGITPPKKGGGPPMPQPPFPGGPKKIR